VATPLIHPEFNGLRVTPNVYNTLDEIDRFADTLLDGIKKGLTA